MAEYDGSVKIDSSLDSNAVKAGAEQIEKAIKQLQSSIERSSQSMYSAITSILDKLNGEINVVVNNAGQIAGGLDTAGDSMSKLADGAGKLNSELDSVAKKTDKIKQNTQNTADTENKSQDNRKRVRKAETQIDADSGNPKPNTPDNVTNIEKKSQAIDELTNKVLRYKESLEGKDRASQEFADLEKEIERTENAYNRLIDRQELMRHLGVNDKNQKQFERLGETIEYTRQELEQLNGLKETVPLASADSIIRSSEALNLLSERVQHYKSIMEGKDNSTDEFKSLESEIKRVQREIEKLTAKQQTMVNTGDTNTVEYQKLVETLVEMRRLYSELAELRDSALAAPNIPKGWNDAISLSGMLKDAFNKLGEVGRTAIYSIQHPIEALDRGIGTVIQNVWSLLGNLAKSALHAAASLAKIAGNAALSYLSKLAQSAKNAVIQLMKLASNAIASGIKKIGSAAKSAANALWNAAKAVLSFNKNTNKSNVSIKSGIRFLIRYGLGLRSVFALVNKLRKALVDAFGNMAKQVPEVNKILSSLASSLDLLKNSLATAFQPILSTVGPLLSTLMDNVSEAMNTVGEFFATLTGQGYIYKATKAQIDYAKSLDKTKKKAKDAENQLAGFDHLNILKDNSKEGKEDDPTATFEKSPIKVANALAEKLKELFNSGDFYGIGALIAEKLTEIVDGIYFATVGKKIGEWVNHVVDAVNGFVDNFDWIGLGKKFANGFMAIIDEVDPYELGRFLTQKFRLIIETLYGFVTGLDFEVIGVFIAEALRGAFDNIPWETLAELIAKSINGILTAIYTAAELFPWAEAGERIADALRIMIMGIDIDALYRAFRSVLIGVLSFIIPILEDGATWDKIASDFSTFLNNFFQDDTLWAKAIEAVKLAIERVVGMIKKVVAEFQWGENGTRFGENLYKLVDSFPDDLGQVLSDLLSVALLFMGNVIGDGEIFNNLAMKMAGWVNQIFANKEMWDNLGTTVNKLLAGILTFGQTFLDEFKPEVAAENIKSALSQINWTGIATSTWNLLKTALNKAGSFVDALFSESINSEKAGMSGEYLAKVTAFNQKSLGERMGIRIREALAMIPWETIATEVWTAAKTAFTVAGDLVSALLGVDTSGMDAGKKIEAIGNAIGEKLSSFANTVGSKLAELPWKDIFATAFNVISETLSGLISGLLDGENENGNILLWVGALLAAIKLGLPGVIAKAGIGTMLTGLIGGLGKTLSVAIGGIGTALTTALNTLGTTIATGISGIAAAVNPVVPGVVAAVAGIYDVAELANAANTYNKAFEAHKNETETMLGLYQQLYETKGKEVADEWANTVLQIDTTSMSLDESQKAITDKVNGYWDGVPQNMWDGFSQGWNHYFGDANSGGGQGGGLGGLVVDAFSTAVDGVRNFLRIGSPSKVFESIGHDTLEGYEVGVNGEAPNMENTVNTAFDRVVNVTDTKWNEAADKQQSALNAMDSGVSTTMNTMTDTATTGADNQSAPLYEKWGEAEYLTQICLEDIKNDVARYMGLSENESNNGMNGIQNSIQNGMNNVTNTARSGFNDIYYAAQSVNWYDIGNGIAQGIGYGINNNWSWLHDTVWNLAQSLLNAAKSSLGIHSPSRVFRDAIGANIGLGIAEGITDTEPAIMDSVSNLADLANETMNDNGMNGEFEADGTGLVDGLDGVLTTFSDRVQSSFTDMLSKLSAIAENVSFRVPNFAAGTVLPYNITGRADSGDNSDVSDTITASNEELISVIIQAVNNQTTALIRAIEQNSNNSNERKINTDSIIDEINRRTKAMGKSPLLI